MKSIVSFFILLQIAFSCQVTVSVYYETKCKDSIAFITEQLVPTWKHFGGAGNSVLVIDYIPYGKANVEPGSNTGTITIHCHHGPEECRKNKEHACAIRHLLKLEITPFINCSLIQNVESCTKPEKLEEIANCVDNDEGHQLLLQNGERTDNLKPSLTFVPWILFDGDYSLADNNDSQKNLTEVICRKTKACGDTSDSISSNSNSTSKSTPSDSKSAPDPKSTSKSSSSGPISSLCISILTIVFALKMN